MNRSFFIVIVPALFVLIGYIVVLRRLGLPAGYFRLLVATGGLLLAAVVVRRYGRKSGRSRQ